VFCLLVVGCQYLLSDWLERLLVRKPNCGKEIISTKPKLKSIYEFFGLVYRFIVLLHLSCPRTVHIYIYIFHTAMI